MWVDNASKNVSFEVYIVPDCLYITSAVRETDGSRHNEDSVKGPLKSLNYISAVMV